MREISGEGAWPWTVRTFFEKAIELTEPNSKMSDAL